LWHWKAIKDAVADAPFEPYHEVCPSFQQGGQKVKAEISAIKNISPVPDPV
jgi:hypothetical protein